MPPGLPEHIPLLVAAGALTVSGIIGVVKGYKWLLKEIREAITDSLANHERVEEEWQKVIEHRLEDIESKVDALTAAVITRAKDFE